jgi:hypothetical protein
LIARPALAEKIQTAGASASSGDEAAVWCIKVR